MLASAGANGLAGRRTFLRALGLVLVLAVLSLTMQDVAWDAFSQRVMNSREDENRALTAFTNAFEYFDVAGLTGFGTGAANLGSVGIVGEELAFSWLPFGLGFEEESGRIVLELGSVGWAISLAMRISLLLWSLQLSFGTRQHHSRAIGLLALPLMALGVHQGNGVFAAPVFSAYYWFCVALMAMARHESRAAKRASLTANARGAA